MRLYLSSHKIPAPNELELLLEKPASEATAEIRERRAGMIELTDAQVYVVEGNDGQIITTKAI